MTKLPTELKNIKVDWPAEINKTLETTGWTKSELAEALGMYVQPARENQGPVSQQLYAWLRGRNQPRVYLLYALRYLRSHYGQEPVKGSKAKAKPKE
jgi:transcriptional regulator with XRE-family HTH domain